MAWRVEEMGAATDDAGVSGAVRSAAGLRVCARHLGGVVEQRRLPVARLEFRQLEQRAHLHFGSASVRLRFGFV